MKNFIATVKINEIKYIIKGDNYIFLPKDKT